MQDEKNNKLEVNPKWKLAVKNEVQNSPTGLLAILPRYAAYPFIILPPTKVSQSPEAIQKQLFDAIFQKNNGPK